MKGLSPHSNVQGPSAQFLRDELGRARRANETLTHLMSHLTKEDDMAGLIDIVETFDTEEEAVARRERLLEQYHPAGYGTSLHVGKVDPKDEPDEQYHGKWFVRGTRYASCD